MQIDGKPHRTIWLNKNGWSVDIIDQTKLPHAFVTLTLTTVREAGHVGEEGFAILVGQAGEFGFDLG